jgi:tRNA A-37 threonylcarbamoyl transferase component Bud32
MTIAILKFIKFFMQTMEKDLSTYDCFSKEYKDGYSAAVDDMNWMIDQKIADVRSREEEVE